MRHYTKRNKRYRSRHKKMTLLDTAYLKINYPKIRELFQYIKEVKL
jgi:hypothetical protein